MYDCLKSEYGIKQEDLILYGQSVGSGPTVHLASKLQNLRGVILHSAILSGIRVLYPVKMIFWFDIFKVSFALVLFIIFNPLHYLSLISFVLTNVSFIISEYRQNKACYLSSLSYTCMYIFPFMFAISFCIYLSFSIWTNRSLVSSLKRLLFSLFNYMNWMYFNFLLLCLSMSYSYGGLIKHSKELERIKRLGLYDWFWLVCIFYETCILSKELEKVT